MKRKRDPGALQRETEKSICRCVSAGERICKREEQTQSERRCEATVRECIPEEKEVRERMKERGEVNEMEHLQRER